MSQPIRYLNADLDLVSPTDFDALVRALRDGGVYALDAELAEDGLWHGTFETDDSYDQPDANLNAFLAVVETFMPPLREQWLACTLREFNIGYDCGDEPWAYNHGLSAQTLRRLANAGVSLRITLYPERPDDEGERDERFPES